jgi:hypothetical protein
VITENGELLHDEVPCVHGWKTIGGPPDRQQVCELIANKPTGGSLPSRVAIYGQTRKIVAM